MAGSWLVVGLGNPGERYANTRHNAGAMVTERLAERLGTRFRKVRFLPLLAAEASVDGVALLLTAPGTFMNIGGPPVASLARKRGIPTDRLVVVHDEMDLAFGALRIKRGGSTAGHHGLDSLVGALRTPDFHRVRIGVGRPSRRPQNVDFLLDPFTKREWKEVGALIEEAADAVLALVTEGLEAAQSRFNRGPRG